MPIIIKRRSAPQVGIKRHNNNSQHIRRWIGVVTTILALLMIIWIVGTIILIFSFPTQQEQSSDDEKNIHPAILLADKAVKSPSMLAIQTNSSSLELLQDHDIPPYTQEADSFDSKSCPITSIISLSDAELHPMAGTRHMVSPPDGGPTTLVCCSTTKGYLSLLLHTKWAPIGVERFLDMVQTKYFDSKIPLFRCSDACQFGLSGNPNTTKRYDKRLQDDPNWLPPGKDHRENSNGIRRYPSGFLTYAGAGPNSRNNQFVLTLQPNRFMGGGSPWEVPLGELVGSRSFETMKQLHTGYGHINAPGQALLRREGYSERVQKEWPLMDLILGCRILDEHNLGP